MPWPAFDMGERGETVSLIAATLTRFGVSERRTIAVACGAHVLHDGFTDLLYVLLPLW
jgi:FSR family fosmidomycin resistance protein-like MFS transporter